MKIRVALNLLFVQIVSLPISRVRSWTKLTRLLGVKEGIRAVLSHVYGRRGRTYGVRLTIGINQVALQLRSKSSDLAIFTNVFSGELDVLDIPEISKLSSSPSRPIILDAGAHIGFTAVAFATRYPNSMVIAVEPDPENFELLKANCLQLSNVLPKWGALVGTKRLETDTSIQLNSRGNGFQGFTVVEKPLDREITEIRSSNVPAYSIVSLLDDVSNLWLLKLDIEGGELEILRQDLDLLASLPVVLIELHERIAGSEIGLLFDELALRMSFQAKDAYDKYLLANVHVARSN